MAFWCMFVICREFSALLLEVKHAEKAVKVFEVNKVRHCGRRWMGSCEMKLSILLSGRMSAVKLYNSNHCKRPMHDRYEKKMKHM